MTSHEALIREATQHYASGNLAATADLCRHVLKSSPRQPDALRLLGFATYKSGDSKRAVRYLGEAQALRPSDAKIARYLGFARRDSGDLDGAAESFQKAISLDQNDVVSHYRLGVLLGDRGQYDEAIPHFDAVLERDARNRNAHHRRGRALRATGRIAEAERGYAEAARLLPDDYIVFTGWGTALHELERYEEAGEKHQMALERGPPEQIAANIEVCIGDSYIERGLLGEAKARYSAARDRDPGHADAASALADVYYRERDYQRCYDLVRPLVADDPPRLSVALCFAKIAPRFGETELALERLQACLAQTGLRPHKKRRLHFARGMLSDSAGEFETALQDYRAANNLYGDESYDPAESTATTDNMIEVIDEATAARLRLRESLSDKPVFILGMMRSGTSLVEQILASHSRVAGGGELLTLPNLLFSLPDQLGVDPNYSSLIGRIDASTVESVARTYLEELQTVDPTAARVTDKLPGNFLHLWLIGAAFPGAPIIHCTRHPLDTCLSCYFQDFGGRHSFTRDLSHLGRYYADYRRLMAHWKDTLDLNMIEVPYEEMVADTEALSRKIVEFCGLDWDPACLEFHENRRYVATASFDQVRRPIYARSVGRHLHYEPYIGELKDALKGVAPQELPDTN